MLQAIISKWDDGRWNTFAIAIEEKYGKVL